MITKTQLITHKIENTKSDFITLHACQTKTTVSDITASLYMILNINL